MLAIYDTYVETLGVIDLCSFQLGLNDYIISLLYFVLQFALHD